MIKYFEGKQRLKTAEVVREISLRREKYYFDFLNKKFICYPTVFPPKYFTDSEFFAQEMSISPNERILEIGCGTGVLSIFAIFKGAQVVFAGDINPVAALNTLENARLHQLQSKIHVFCGDIFRPLRGLNFFDTIVWNVPFAAVREENLSPLEQALWDTKYRRLTRFISEAHHYHGRIILGFSSTIGDLNYLQNLCARSDYKIKLVKSRISKSVGDTMDLKFEIFELTH